VGLAEEITALLGGPLPVRLACYDGSVAEAATGSPAAAVTVHLVRPAALARLLQRPGELGLARAYVAGDLEVEGDLEALFALKWPALATLVRPRTLVRLKRLLDKGGAAPDPPAIEANPSGWRHSRARDATSVTHHYDVSNRFYEMVLGPSMTYSCAVFATPDDTLEDAQRRKVDLVCRKLDLQRGERLLDVGCGWGSLALHAAREYGARVVGITLSRPQCEYATQRARDEGLSDLVEFRVQDYRAVDDRPFDAISSIGMAEHVGRRQLGRYGQILFDRLAPGGRLLNHAIARPVSDDADPRPGRLEEARYGVAVALARSGPSRVRSPFIERYVFPDGELHEVGTMVTLLQARGFEVRHLESLREHYTLTLRRWVANLEANWDAATAEVGAERARVWRLYMTGSAVGFATRHLEIHQVLAVRPIDGTSGMALRPSFEPTF
jgi:cyclopropane-fatty-acyl-phospholipid synthase